MQHRPDGMLSGFKAANQTERYRHQWISLSVCANGRPERFRAKKTCQNKEIEPSVPIPSERRALAVARNRKNTDMTIGRIGE
jgi:hypothetical protein